MIGEPIVAAFRLEKFANARTGRILACPETNRMAAGMFEFRDLGRMQAKGFDRPDHVFALERARPAGGASR
jgi:class 3 adenylate cyclase